MKLQFKFALYNALTKIAIIVFLGLVIVFSIKNISINHIKLRLKEKRTKIIAQLSDPEIKNFLAKEGNYTDYNLFYEEYFTLSKIPAIINAKESFSQGDRIIAQKQLTYQILTQDFKHNNSYYRLELGETLTTVNLLEKTITNFTLLVLVVVALISFAGDLFFSKLLLSPFYKIISEKINKVNDPIHFNYQPIKTSTKDFLVLDESISMLMNKIKAFVLAQKEFIGNVSHELLTPISVLTVRNENMLSEDNLSVESQNKIFANLKTLARLKAIINSLLMISKIENEQYIKDENVAIRGIVDDVVAELEHRLLLKSLTIELKLDADFTFNANASLIHILISNLMSNAIKYNVPNGKIVVTTREDAKFFELLISDTGQGMPQEEVANVFHRFTKLKHDDAESYGLGLAIVKHIADFHEIAIHLSSVPQQGTTVTLKFAK